MNAIDAGCEKALATVLIKITNTGVFQDITDARKKALTEISDAARDIVIDIQVAAPFSGLALGIPTAAILGTVGQAS